MLLACLWSWLQDFVGLAVSYLSYLHYEQLAADTQLRLDLVWYLVSGALLS